MFVLQTYYSYLRWILLVTLLDDVRQDDVRGEVKQEEYFEVIKTCSSKKIQAVTIEQSPGKTSTTTTSTTAASTTITSTTTTSTHSTTATSTTITTPRPSKHGQRITTETQAPVLTLSLTSSPSTSSPTTVQTDSSKKTSLRTPIAKLRPTTATGRREKSVKTTSWRKPKTKEPDLTIIVVKTIEKTTGKPKYTAKSVTTTTTTAKQPTTTKTGTNIITITIAIALTIVERITTATARELKPTENISTRTTNSTTIGKSAVGKGTKGHDNSGSVVAAVICVFLAVLAVGALGVLARRFNLIRRFFKKNKVEDKPLAEERPNQTEGNPSYHGDEKQETPA